MHHMYNCDQLYFDFVGKLHENVSGNHHTTRKNVALDQ
jgi:hypothetical protein